MQLALDVGLAEERDANTTAAAVGALAALARNLPVSETLLFPPDDTSTQPNPVTLLLMLCDRFWPTSEQSGAQDKPCRACRQIVTRSLGLLTDVASNDDVARLRIKGSAPVATAWAGAQSCYGKFELYHRRQPRMGAHVAYFQSLYVLAAHSHCCSC